MNRQEREKKKEIDKIMYNYNIFRVVVIVGLIALMCILVLKNGTNKNTGDNEVKNTNEVQQETSYYDRFKKDYKSFKGETVDFSKLNIGEMIIEDGKGYTLFPYASLDELKLAITNVRNEYGFENEYMNLEQVREYDGFTGVNKSGSVIKTYKCKKEDESIEVYAESLGNVGTDCNRMIITIKGEGWDRVEKISTSFLKELKLSEEIIEAINKSETVNGAKLHYSNSENNITLSMTKKVSDVCEFTLNIFNNLPEDKVEMLDLNSIGYESTEGYVKFPNLVKSDKSNDLSFENKDKLFGKDLENMFDIRFKDKLVSCDVKVKTTGAKMGTGYILGETTEFDSLYTSESGKYTVNLVGVYTEGSANIALNINKTGDEKITAEERENMRIVLHEFTTYLDSNTDLNYYELKESENRESNTIHFSMTDSTGNVTTVSYSYDNNNSCLTLTKSYSVLSDRTESFDTYK